MEQNDFIKTYIKKIIKSEIIKIKKKYRAIQSLKELRANLPILKLSV